LILVQTATPTVRAKKQAEALTEPMNGSHLSRRLGPEG